MLNLSNRPENLIMKNIAVPPIAIRPSVIVDRSLRLSQHAIYSLADFVSLFLSYVLLRCHHILLRYSSGFKVAQLQMMLIGFQFFLLQQ